MPIKLNVVDNNSEVRVKPKSNDEVRLKPDCGIDNARYEALVNKEKQDRIAADEALQKQITDNKINFIPLDSYITVVTSYQKEGVLPQELLVYLRNNKLNKVILGNKVYYLAVKDGNTQQYFSNTSGDIPGEPNFNKVNVNLETGEFIVKDTWLDAQAKAAQQHMDNREIHITAEERVFWNNKLNCDDNVSEETETLILNRN